MVSLLPRFLRDVLRPSSIIALEVRDRVDRSLQRDVFANTFAITEKAQNSSDVLLAIRGAHLLPPLNVLVVSDPSPRRRDSLADRTDIPLTLQDREPTANVESVSAEGSL